MSSDRKFNLWVLQNPYAILSVSDDDLADLMADIVTAEVEPITKSDRSQCCSSGTDKDVDDLAKSKTGLVKSTHSYNSDIRRDCQNPYAYVDRDAMAIRKITKPVVQTSYSNSEIEHKVRSLHKRVWASRNSIWPDCVPTEPTEMIDPRFAIELIGFSFENADYLCDSTGCNNQIAGIIDQESKKISISRQFSSQVSRFTAAHELGHAMLHSEMSMHRDRPIDGSDQKRAGAEVEADKFATYFLMPEKLVRKYFQQVFGVTIFTLTENTAFALDPVKPHDFVARCTNTRALSRVLAKAGYYNGSYVVSLADRFHVSVETMAIRVEELGLVKF